ncbi:MAG: amidohydrolase [Nevskiaceae bacterium]|nr:MAG: amidohydrolase [Nevskiaceae bacterium]TAM21712.1 MAG: amidohydrolase [Nevskiaceae bacterium]
MNRHPWLRRARVLAPLALALALPAQAGLLAITNAKLYTVSGGALENATLLIRNDLIEAVGVGLTVPEGAKLIDAGGASITPGLFDAYTHIGLEEISGIDETRDDAGGNPRYSAALDVLDGLNPRSVLIPVNRIEGITQAMSAPTTGEGGPLLAGRGAVINLGQLGPQNFIARAHAAQFVPFGEAAMAQLHGGRPTVLLALREAFEEVRNGGHSGVQRDSLLGALDIEALRPVLNGEQPLVVDAQRAADIRALLKFAEDYGIKLVIHGGAEAHLLARELAEKQVPVILDPTYNLPIHFEALAARADAAAILHRAGVLLAFSAASDMGSHNSRNIRQLAGNAVAYGLPWSAALAAVTLNPAKVYGLDSTIGSLETGKQANFVIWDGDPLEVTSYPKQVYAAGVAIPMSSRQTQLRDRYLKR